MADGVWSVDRFVGNLTATLTATLSTANDMATMARIVVASAAVAEEVCAGRPMACAAGCPHCCVLNVAVLLPEALLIAEHLRRELAPAEFAAVHVRLAEHRRWTRGMEDEERIAKQTFCSLLDGAGCCSIHAARPLVCRAVASLDRNRCRAAFSPVLTDEERLVPADPLRQSVYDAAFTTLAQTLQDHGFDDRSIELGGGVLAFIEQAECREQFLAGLRLPDALWDR